MTAFIADVLISASTVTLNTSPGRERTSFSAGPQDSVYIERGAC